MGSTAATKIWDRHVVATLKGRDLLYVDLHFTHELSPQAFDSLRNRGLVVRRPQQTLAVMDHIVPTVSGSEPLDSAAAAQLAALRENCARHRITLFGIGSTRQGIAHVVRPELGLSRPGITIACGDSHTSTHGALGALALGIGTTQVEQVLATQCLLLARPQQIAVIFDGESGAGVTAKDMALAVVRELGVGGAAGHVIEYRGAAVRGLSVEGRMTLCNLSAETGARTSIISPDQRTYDYLWGLATSLAGGDWLAAVDDWSALATDENTVFDREIRLDATAVEPTVTWGTTPAMSAPVNGCVPNAAETSEPAQTQKALAYMGLKGGERIVDISVDRVFIGSCANARISDLRAAAAVLGGRRVAPNVSAMVVPGSMAVKRQAEREGLADAFRDAGFDWRAPGCSMCVGMNADLLGAGERCAATSNRNYEGRQGAGGRTHLVSPAMAAAAAIAGHFVDVRKWL
ncbi:3-isopropylmalate dehydratase large subunit [Mycobacterium genavense]|uniref:3-isopropylmalate dehydratase large subunit n=1 Tax=Mycobacterium genavense TaxID=36812 RepID=UPI0004705EDA|nr:3-isopropylmalate dehydratase large subunit [Mycobacterium genavense]